MSETATKTPPEIRDEIMAHLGVVDYQKDPSMGHLIDSAKNIGAGVVIATTVTAGVLAGGAGAGAVKVVPGNDGNEIVAEIEEGDTLERAIAALLEEANTRGKDLETTDPEVVAEQNGNPNEDLVHAGEHYAVDLVDTDNVVTSYRIQPEDTAGAIALEHGITLEELHAANPQIVNINKIIAGQSLNIPGSTEQRVNPYDLPVYRVTPGSPDQPVQDNDIIIPGTDYAVLPDGTRYTVQIGDNVSEILTEYYENSAAPEVETYMGATVTCDGEPADPDIVREGCVVARGEDSFVVEDGDTVDEILREADGRGGSGPQMPEPETNQAPENSDPSESYRTEINGYTKDWHAVIPLGKDYQTKEDVDAFLQKVEELANELEVDPDWLMTVFSFETAGTFSPSIRNPNGSATGLIQFLRVTAEDLGTSIDELASMTPIQQLDWVREYFIDSKGDLRSLEDVYLKVFYPAAIGQSDDFIVGPPGSRTYNANRGFDTDNDGAVTKNEISSTIRDRYLSIPDLPVESPSEEGDSESSDGAGENQEDAPESQPEDSEEQEEPEDPETDEEAEAEESLHHLIMAGSETFYQETGVTTVLIKPADGLDDPFEVNVSVADAVARMIEHAYADGVTLYGGGFRTPQEQIELRRQHCDVDGDGASNYDIYDRPSSQCSPPTARPGSSNHEKGLAIDFKNCSDRITVCYQWLAANAADYGFYNLPSESWHWSVNGR